MNEIDYEVIVRVECMYKDSVIPKYKTDGSSGMDLHAYVCNGDKSLHLRPGCKMLVKTGIKIALPVGYEAQIRPRSGLALKHGIGLVNSPGTIDNDYRGEIGAILINWGVNTFKIEHGMRVAQMVVQPVMRAILYKSMVGETNRGSGGFGHTGH